MTNEAWLEPLSDEECLRRLRENRVGRIGTVIEDGPIVVPVNYRLVEACGLTFLALRTRPGNVVARGGMMVALEIDEVDPGHREGWSVLVRGTLHRIDPEAADFRTQYDSEPWLVAERDAWLIIQPYAITGRRLRRAVEEWAFHVPAHL